MLPLKYSFRLLSKAKIKKIRFGLVSQNKNFSASELQKTPEADANKRRFLKMAGIVGLGAVASLFIPKKAEALIFGSTPASNVVGIKDSDHNPINPVEKSQLPATLTTAGNLKVSIEEATAAVKLKKADGTTVINPATEDTVSTLATQATLSTLSTTASGLASEDAITYLRRMVKQMDSLGVVDSSQRQRIVIDSGTVTTVSTVTTVTSMTGLSGVDAKYLLIDTARNAYANMIRANLTWS